tara:strand:+ start:497 stop:700 length:204 start_codon:yes stop_codon:yes gene_type:complete
LNQKNQDLYNNYFFFPLKIYVTICVIININPMIKKYVESDFNSKFINLYLESKNIVNKNKAIEKLSN